MTSRTSGRRRHDRGWRWALALTVVAALVASGCTPSSGGGGSDPTADANTITVWHYFSEESQVAMIDDYKRVFEDANPGATVNDVFVPIDQLNTKVLAAAASGSGPDVLVMNGAETSVPALAGALAPMDDYWESFADRDQVLDAVVHKVDDQVYGVQGYVNLLGLWYNADILDEVGVDPPTTPAELDAALEAVVEAGYEGITFAALPKSQGEFQAHPWLTNFGFDYEDPQAEPLREAFEMAQGWADSGALTREASTWDHAIPFQTWAAGDVAFAQNGNWNMGVAENTADFEYGVVPIPVVDDAQIYLGGESAGIGAFSENPDLAWQYLEDTFLSPEGQAIALDRVGSIPSRADAASEASITDDPILAAFEESASEHGANYPPPVVPSENIAQQQIVVAQAWSSVISGTSPPSEAADKLLDQLTPLLKTK